MLGAENDVTNRKKAVSEMDYAARLIVNLNIY